MEEGYWLALHAWLGVIHTLTHSHTHPLTLYVAMSPSHMNPPHMGGCAHESLVCYYAPPQPFICALEHA